MSADEYITCPICDGIPPLYRDYKKQYGKIPEADYRKLLDEVAEYCGSQTVEIYQELTLIDNNTVTFSMNGYCSICKAEWVIPETTLQTKESLKQKKLIIWT